MHNVVPFIVDVTAVDDKSYIEIRELSSTKKKQYYYTYSELDKIQHHHNSEDTYFGIFTRRTKRGTSDVVGHTAAFVVDVDLKDGTISTDAYTPYTSLLTPTYVVFSGRGFHLYFCLHEPIEPQTWQPLQKDLLMVFSKRFGSIIDVKITDTARVMRLPGSVNSKSKRMCEIVYSSGRKYSLEEIQQFLREQGEEDNTIHRSLSKDTIDAICDLLTPFYVEGERHNIALHLAGTLYKYGVSLDDALQIVTTLSTRMHDEEDRTRQVVETYKKDVRSVVSLASYTNIDYTTYTQILSHIKKHTTYTHKISDDLTVTNDPTTNTIRINNTVLALFCIKQKRFVIERNFLTGNEEHFVEFDITTTYNTTHTLRYAPAKVDEIFKELSAYITCPTQKHKALLLRFLHQMPYITIYTYTQHPGVYTDENKNIHVIVPHTYTTLELFDEVYALNKFVHKHYGDMLDIVSTIFLWSTVAPLWYVLKQYNLTMPYLYLAGESATAKTTLAELFIARFNNTQMHTADSVRTIARMRHILSASMFPQVIDEASALLSSTSQAAVDAVALLLAAYNNNRVGITLSPASTQREFYATSLLAFTSNYAITTQQLLRRVHYILFTRDLQKINADTKAFLKDAEKLALTNIRAYTLERMKSLSQSELRLEFHELGRVLLEPLLPYMQWLKLQHNSDFTITNAFELSTSIISDIRTLIMMYAKYSYEIDKVPFLHVSSDTVYITSAIMTIAKQKLQKDVTVRGIYEALKQYSAKYITSKRDVTASLREHLPVVSVPKAVFQVVVMSDDSHAVNTIAQYQLQHQPEVQA